MSCELSKEHLELEGLQELVDERGSVASKVPLER